MSARGSPRITVVVRKDSQGEPAEVYLYLNPDGREVFVEALRSLNDASDHFHMQDEAWTVELPLRMHAYVPQEESIVSHVKVMLRPDAWDEQYFPHVMAPRPQS